SFILQKQLFFLLFSGGQFAPVLGGQFEMVLGGSLVWREGVNLRGFSTPHSQNKILIPKLSYPEIACQKTIQTGRKKSKKIKVSPKNNGCWQKM
ncbi:hypothetical protein, partial [Ferruginibacter sp.]|uniref:hypothetical protein n=1 Tax=Ferruginibacter sp. TaxID=1940288 RepID=UPI0026581E86